MSYPHPPPPPKHQPSSTYSGSSGDPFNPNPSVQQLPYSDQPGYNPYAHPGPGGAGIAQQGAAGQYAPYFDNEATMGERLDSGGMARETWASESGWSQDSKRSGMASANNRRTEIQWVV